MTYHPFLAALQDWFPHLPIQPFPLPSKLDDLDKIFIFYEKSPWMQAIIVHALEHYPEKTLILNPIATPNHDYPYWENGKFDGNLPFVENLYRFCKEVLKLENCVRTNGIQPPSDAKKGRYPNRVVLHPTSSRPGKNWPQEKFLTLSQRLQSMGCEPVFILKGEEREDWKHLPVTMPQFASLSEIARYVYESGYMIGNDSGIGHLASCLGLPTVTICKNPLAAKFWRPAWSPGEIIFPAKWIPNIKGLRLRDKHWKKWISVRRVFKLFEELLPSSPNARSYRDSF